MHVQTKLTQAELPDFLFYVASQEGAGRPVMIWGPPGIGKSSIVESFAKSIGLESVSLLGSQLAPEDLIGVPRIEGNKSEFCPPKNIAREEPYLLFLDEINACSQDVQKAFYSLINDRRIGEYNLPEDSIVVAAGNRAEDSAITRPLSSALINRMVHVEMKVSHRDWLDWAKRENMHPLVVEYIENRPEHLFSKPPKHEEPFSTPRSWHMLSDALWAYKDAPEDTIEILSYATLTPDHAARFKSFSKGQSSPQTLNNIIKGKENWPADPKDKDVLYDLTLLFRQQLWKELPNDKENLKTNFPHEAKELIRSLAAIDFEYAQILVEEKDGNALPDWFLNEIMRDLPRLVMQEDN